MFSTCGRSFEGENEGNDGMKGKLGGWKRVYICGLEEGLKLFESLNSKIKMKIKLLVPVIMLSILSSCNGVIDKKSDGRINSTATDDSIEYKITYTLTHANPPYTDFDTTLIVKFVNENDFNSWYKENKDILHPKSMERIKK
jgi:hypothetical protein